MTTRGGAERLFPPVHLAELWDVSVPTVRRLERQGKLRGVRIAGQLRFPESAIREFLEKAAFAPRRQPPPELLAAGGRPSGTRRRRRVR